MTPSPIAIIDTGMGNIASIKNILRKIRTYPVIVTNPAELANYKAIIIPGIGHFDEGMKRLNEQGWTAAILNYHQQECGLILGICLGMQLLATSSEEGQLPGLGLIKGNVKRFPAIDTAGAVIKIPHIGWNSAKAQNGETPRFYFVHSYYLEPEDQSAIYFKTTYHITFCSGYHKNAIWGFQFHPEKSHAFGMQLLSLVFKDFIV